jgi:hypothetical protein
MLSLSLVPEVEARREEEEEAGGEGKMNIYAKR